MKNITLLIIASLFSVLLTGCGMKGPLYRAPAAQPANEEKLSTEQDNAISTATDKQQLLTEQEQSESNSESSIK